ncbi:MAG: hypothetical protein LBK63_04920 [Treponema sp.]|jgi:hypothetical protein|nr:hypothetical protein [Treponema sp.]
MKKLLLWNIVLAAILLMVSCPQASVQNLSPRTDPYEGLEPNTFWALNVAANYYYTVDAALLAEGEKCLVWAEKSEGVSVAEGKAIAHEYDKNIYDKIVGTFGSPAIMASGDVDGNGKLILLLLDIKDGFSGSGPYTAGYFYSNDLFESGYSNGSDMIYVDTYPSKLRTPESYATIAHELQHFINYTTRTRVLDGTSGMDTWIDEGLSAAAEYVYLGEHNRERVAQFTLSETVRQGNTFFVWGNLPNSLLDEYSTVYLFFQWLRIQSGGTEIYKRIIESPYSDYRAVTGAISGAFAAGLGTTDWETTLRSWFAANYLNSPEGLYGYHGELPELKVYALGGATQRLRPGEGVYSIADSSGSLPSSGGPNIKYAGLRERSAAGSPPEDPGVNLSALYPKGRLLTFNGNKQKYGGGETGLLTGEDGESIPQFPASGRSAGDSWIIDARDIMGRQDR